MRLRAALAVGMAAGLCAGTAAFARTLEVGPDGPYSRPSQAAAVAQDGDTIHIASGEYFDCAVWRASHLRIDGDHAVITDRPCDGKAAFIVAGDDVTITGLTFARIRVPDGNGAGIRAEARALTVRQSRFENDEAGIIDAVDGGTLRVDDCTFSEVGPRDGTQGRAVLAGRLDQLAVSHSVFERARGGAYIASSAARTELTGNTLSDEDGRMPGPLVHVDGGRIRFDGNRVVLGDAPGGRPGAVLVTGEAVSLEVTGNTLDGPGGTVPLVRNWSGVAATSSGNVVPAGVSAVSDSGGAYHRLRRQLAFARDKAGDVARIAKHEVAEAARGLGLLR